MKYVCVVGPVNRDGRAEVPDVPAVDHVRPHERQLVFLVDGCGAGERRLAGQVLEHLIHSDPDRRQPRAVGDSVDSAGADTGDRLRVSVKTRDDRLAVGALRSSHFLRHERQAEVAERPHACQVGVLLQRLPRRVQRVLNRVGQIEVVIVEIDVACSGHVPGQLPPRVCAGDADRRCADREQLQWPVAALGSHGPEQVRVDDPREREAVRAVVSKSSRRYDTAHDADPGDASSDGVVVARTHGARVRADREDDRWVLRNDRRRALGYLLGIEVRVADGDLPAEELRDLTGRRQDADAL